MRAPVAVLVALACGAVVGVLVTRLAADGTGAGADLLRDRSAWLVVAAVLALLARGPLIGALVGLAAMAGLLGALQLLPWSATPLDVPPELARDLPRGVATAYERLLEDTTWLRPPLLAGGAVAGAAVGTMRLVLRTGRRLLLLVAAVVLVAAIVLAPALDGGFRLQREVTVIR